ncbi:MAG TPA: formate dehydrogenase accessory protein FdhE [Candidatus Methanoperedens sp.]|nr:formate dehydrogenase accessory protein FdhE [Candidatus Methanoperedens sp.]
MTGRAEAAAVFGTLLPLLRDAEVSVAPPALSASAARERLGRGRHLLDGLDLGVDAAAAHELLVHLARVLESTAASAAARRLRGALERAEPHAADLLPHAAAGEREAVAALARDRGLEPDLLWTLAQAALRPALRACCDALMPLVEDAPWERDSCLLCAAPATLGELRADGGRVLRCCRCGAAWRVRRLLCPACGNEDHATLRTLYEAGRHATRRVEACDRCRRYFKLIAAAVPTPADALVLEDLATLPLDLAARLCTRAAAR